MNCRPMSSRALAPVFMTPLVLCGTAQAGETLVARGTLDHFQQDYYGAPENRSVSAQQGSFTVSIDYDPEALLSAADNTSEHWRDAVLSMEFTVYDEQGSELYSRAVDPDLGHYPEASVLDVRYDGGADVLNWQGRRHGGAEWLELTLYGDSGDLEAADWQYPDQPPADFQGTFRFEATLQGASSTENITIGGTVTETGVGTAVADNDGDGVEDAADSCPASYISQTVVIGDSNTGVVNHVDAVGCTISDRIAYCDEVAFNSMQFRGCVGKVSGDLQYSGVISAGDRSLIQEAAARLH